MASELRVNTLKDAAGNNSIATSFVAGGSAKAWADVNASATYSIRNSLNISSVSDLGTGLLADNFSSNMSAADYSAFCLSQLMVILDKDLRQTQLRLLGHTKSKTTHRQTLIGLGFILAF